MKVVKPTRLMKEAADVIVDVIDETYRGQVPVAEAVVPRLI